MPLELSKEEIEAIKACARDWLTFGPGDLGAEHIPDETLEKIVRKCDAALAEFV